MPSAFGSSALLVLLAALSVLLLPNVVQADIQLDNTCPFGNNYIQLVGFACIEAEERVRNPSWDGTWADRGRHNIKAFTLINRNMNRVGIHIGNITYCSNFTIVHSGCSGNITEGSFARNVSRHWAAIGDYFFSDHGSTLSLPNLMEVNAVGKVILDPISSGSILWKCRKDWMDEGLQPECARANDKRFPWAFTLLIPAEQAANPVVTMYKLSGVKSVAIWYENQSFPISLAKGVADFAAYQGISTTMYELSSTPSYDELSALVAQLKATNPDAVIGAANAPSCHPMIQALRDHDFVPKAMFQSYCAGEPNMLAQNPDAVFTLDKSEFDYRMTGTAWTDDMWYPPTNGTPSAQLVYEDLTNAFGEPPQWSVPLVMAAGLMLHNTLEQRDTLDQTAIRNAIAGYNTPTFAGPIGFSTWGQNSAKDVIVLQADSDKNLQIVYPLGAATRNFAYPAPTFEERVFNSKYMHTTLEAVLAIIVGVFMFISVLLLVFLAFFRNHQHVRAASPLFLATILVGSLLMYSVYFSWTLIATTVTCHLRIWLLGLGFVLMFGALFSKTWRVMRIFTVGNIRVFKITNLQLFVVLSILVGIEIVLLALWSAVARTHQVLKIIDPVRPSKNQLVCSSGNLDIIFLALLVTYKLAMVFYGIYMSIRVWKIPRKEFNESRPIAFSMYNMLTFGVITFALQASNAINNPAMFIIRAICLPLSTFFTIAAVFGPKLRAVITGHTGYSTSDHSEKSRTSHLDSHTHSKHDYSTGRQSKRRGSAGESSRDTSTYNTNSTAHNSVKPGSGKHNGTAEHQTPEEHGDYQALAQKYAKLKHKYYALKASKAEQHGDDSTETTSSEEV